MNVLKILFAGLLVATLFACSKSSITDDITEPDVTIATTIYNGFFDDFDEEAMTELKNLTQKNYNQTIMERMTECSQKLLADWTFQEQQEIAKLVTMMYSDKEWSHEEEKWSAGTYEKYKMTVRATARSLTANCLPIE